MVPERVMRTTHERVRQIRWENGGNNVRSEGTFAEKRLNPDQSCQEIGWSGSG
jgi:hypothetical protein